jgi:threonine/homoserine/homoserine lactone efflux protein
LYGCIAGFGLTFISSFLMNQQLWFRLIGGGFLAYLGIKTFLSSPSEQAASVRGIGIIGAYTSTLFLTLTNPITILSFAAIFAGLGVTTAGGNYLAASILVLGVFLGSAFWWLLLSGGVGLMRTKFNPRGLSWVNRISGAIILAFSLLVLLSLIG